MIFELKSNSRINGFNFEIDQRQKTFSIGYREHPGKPLKITYKQFRQGIAELYSKGYVFIGKRWI